MVQLVSQLNQTRVKILLRTSGGDEFRYLTEANRKNALKADRSPHKQQMEKSLEVANALAERVHAE